jgi:hypothetical protein
MASSAVALGVPGAGVGSDTSGPSPTSAPPPYKALTKNAMAITPKMTNPIRPSTLQIFLFCFGVSVLMNFLLYKLV